MVTAMLSLAETGTTVHRAPRYLLYPVVRKGKTLKKKWLTPSFNHSSRVEEPSRMAGRLQVSQCNKRLPTVVDQ
jgi:hypothetical protein